MTRTVVIELRDRGEINDVTLRLVERELDVEDFGWWVEGVATRRS